MEYKIDVDPKVIEMLGPQLYTNVYFVLGELLANAYDADASDVYIINDISNKIITVEDNGSGMSSKVLQEEYLVVGRDKREQTSSVTAKYGRKKMGRKGIGKLAALSISDMLEIMTVTEFDEPAGVFFPKKIPENAVLKEIPAEDIKFIKITTGTAIKLKNVKYKLHSTRNAVFKNLSKIFPIIDETFNLHYLEYRDGKVVFEKEIELGEIPVDKFDCFLYFPENEEERKNFPKLIDKFDEQYKDACKIDNVYTKVIPLVGIDGLEKEYELKVSGWVGMYKSTVHINKDKNEMALFPEAHLSIYANKKMGEFNIIDRVTNNRISMSTYLTGRLNIELFENDLLPDMAMSNRQGYSEEDPRFLAAMNLIHDEIIYDIGKLRSKSEGKRKISKLEKNNKKMEKKANLILSEEKKLLSKVEKFKKNNPQLESVNELEEALGIKSSILNNTKRILISHISKDKKIVDLVVRLLINLGVPSADIIYTSVYDKDADFFACQIPSQYGILDYLQKFFVESSLRQDMLSLFIISPRYIENWNTVLEAGGAWVSKTKHRVLYLDGSFEQLVLPPLNQDKYAGNIRIEGQEVKRGKEKKVNIEYDFTKYRELIEGFGMHDDSIYRVLSGVLIDTGYNLTEIDRGEFKTALEQALEDVLKS